VEFVRGFVITVENLQHCNSNLKIGDFKRRLIKHQTTKTQLLLTIYQQNKLNTTLKILVINYAA